MNIGVEKYGTNVHEYISRNAFHYQVHQRTQLKIVVPWEIISVELFKDSTWSQIGSFPNRKKQAGGLVMYSSHTRSSLCHNWSNLDLWWAVSNKTCLLSEHASNKSGRSRSTKDAHPHSVAARGKLKFWSVPDQLLRSTIFCTAGRNRNNYTFRLSWN